VQRTVEKVWKGRMVHKFQAEERKKKIKAPGVSGEDCGKRRLGTELSAAREQL